MKVLPGVSKHKALDCLHREIKILSQCDHPNIARIKEASFDGVLIKESIVNDSSPKPSESKSQLVNTNTTEIVKRKTNICYYVMKLAEYGELFRFVEHTDRFSERLAKTLFSQIILGLEYLHLNGIAHRDIKPENLLIDKNCRLIIADFGFAI